MESSTKKLSQENKKEIVGLLINSLGEKINPIFGKSKAEAFLLQFINLSNCITVMKKGKVAGVLTYKNKKTSFLNPSMSDFFKFYGFFEGLWRILISIILDHKLEQGEIYIEALVVDESCRGQGVGSSLINKFFSLAKKQRCEKVTLDVVDTNPKARRLYERLGFEPWKENKIGVLRFALGFSFRSSHTLIKNI